MRLILSILLVLMASACGPRHGHREKALVLYFHEKLAADNLYVPDQKAIQADLAKRKNLDYQACLDHMAFADQVLQARLRTLSPNDRQAELYMRAIADGMTIKRAIEDRAL